MAQNDSVWKSNREALMGRLRDTVAVVFAAPETIRNNDVHHDYRQDSDFYYLSGCEEPDSVLVLAPHREPGDQTAIFLRTKDPEREVWDGERIGVDAAPARLGVDKAFPIGRLAELLPEWIKGVRKVHYAFGRWPVQDAVMTDAVNASARIHRRHGHETPSEIVAPEDLLWEQRLIKTPPSIESMRKAAKLAALGHRRAMAVARPGQHEYQLQAAMEYEWAVRGSRRTAYSSIVGGGPNACVLHYRDNNRPIADGELVLIDAGCEVEYFASDITRTWPISGRFTPPQRQIYELVLAAQYASIALCRPGRPFQTVHDETVKVLTAGLVELGLLQGPVEARLADETYKRFYMHRTSHWLGMDVHDVGRYRLGGTSRALEPGMVLTVEPGLYISPNDETVPARYRGIGIRIEDDVLVTSGEPDVLSADAPKEVEALEALIGSATLA